ncbi:BZ3500_MvSof-1268-A1-R1_Chr6-3g08876 [Microbotryum saponariae]|uniref:BZ3500_MvSof-1268-A1-R1_Chr6-3g08876 protein n=1 Tax=Microbotryum saponariae TaxID=289078 RepID=A0A2X0MPE4_9BASI|nr:BZ3500_MvSof-1268-A1-R1_Chr6-3g08876 [Microbotryum saponariae]
MVPDLPPGDAQTFYSADSVENEDGSLFSIKYLQSLNIAGMPLHAARFKTVVNSVTHPPARGHHSHRRSGWTASFVATDHAEDRFPIRLAMAMTFSKLQEQSLAQVGVCLETPVFYHGQLYVALS